MANQKITVNQIIVTLRQIDHLCAAGHTTQAAVESCGIRMNTYYRWREKYGWMTPDEAARLQQLEEENTRLKQLVAMWSALAGAPMPAYAAEGSGNKE